MGSKGRIRAGTSITTIVATSLVALAVLMPGVASAHGTVLAPQGEVAEASNCVIHTLAGVMRQGEFKQAGDVGDIVEVECNPAVFPGGTPVEISDPQLLSRCSLSGGTVTWLNPNEFNTGVAKTSTGRETVVELDGNGNANVALVAGPNCAVGDTVVSAHTQLGNGNTTVESFAAGFAVEPARPSPEGVTVTPSSQVEDEASSSVATLIQVESGSTEAKVQVAAPELFSRCEVAPHLTWLRPNGEVIVGVKELAGGTAVEPTELEALRTDNDGNAFVIVLGTSSCKPGKSFFEVDLEESPFTTEEPSFTILPPQATAEPAFTIEKLQRIAGTGAGYTTETLTGTVGETVEYEIVVKNTAPVATTFTNFTDPECDPGTVVGGPSGPVSQGASTTYRCTRALKVPGTVTNEAEVTGTTVGGTPKTAPSNVVKVTVSEPAKPSFTLEKLQRITGAFTTAPLMGTIGEVVEYEIVARNTGNVALTFGEIEDHFCELGTVAGGPGGIPVGPGGTTTWTCTRPLPTEGTFENVASVSATPPGGAPISETSQPVEVTVPAVGPGPGTSQFTVEKLQRIGAGSTYTIEELHGTIGQTVEYEIVVSNTGTTPLPHLSPHDSYCDAGTVAGGPGAAPLEPGHDRRQLCERRHGRGDHRRRDHHRTALAARAGQRAGRTDTRCRHDARDQQPAAPRDSKGSGPREVRSERAGRAWRERPQARKVHGPGQRPGRQADHLLPRRAQAEDAAQLALAPGALHAQGQRRQALNRGAPAVLHGRDGKRELREGRRRASVRAPVLGTRNTAFHRLERRRSRSGVPGIAGRPRSRELSPLRGGMRSREGPVGIIGRIMRFLLDTPLRRRYGRCPVFPGGNDDWATTSRTG
jgi:hypothetical protein